MLRQKGNVSVDPEVILKMILLLFFDNVPSEWELMKTIVERLEYLWFFGYGLKDEIADAGDLSKARTCWGKEVSERLFMQTIEDRCGSGPGRRAQVECGLKPDGDDASRELVIEGAPSA